MNLSHSTEMSIRYLSWVNQELRKEADRRAELENQPNAFSQLGSYLVAGVSGVVLALMNLLDF